MRAIVKRSLFVFVILVCSCFVNVYADVFYTNKNGVQMTELEYTKLSSIFSEKRLDILTYEEYEKYKDSTILSNEVLYEKATYENGNLKSTELITEAEYKTANTAEVTPNGSTRDSDSSFIETTYKKFAASLVDSGSFSLIGNVEWKKMPACRSYDVFAYRFLHFDYSGFSGTQIYTIDGTNHYIYYYTSSEGYKAQSTGAGVSMNLKDGSDITAYDLTVMTNLNINTSDYSQAHAFISYQHAQSTLTRAQSMGYTLDIMGLGSVIYFSDTSIRNKYDGMSGLHLTTPI